MTAPETLQQIVAEMRTDFTNDCDIETVRLPFDKLCAKVHAYADRLERLSAPAAQDRREYNEERFEDFCNQCWDVPNEDHPILSFARADLRRIYKLALHCAPAAATGGVIVPDEMVPWENDTAQGRRYKDGWNACLATVLNLNATPPPPRDAGREQKLIERCAHVASIAAMNAAGLDRQTNIDIGEAVRLAVMRLRALAGGAS